MDEMFLQHFPQTCRSEEDCEKFLYKLRWPAGFCCPRCDHESCYKINTRKLYECRDCRTQVSVTAGTIMHKSKLSLLVWFKAIDLLVEGEKTYTSSALAEELEINYRSARLLLGKLEVALHKQFNRRDGKSNDVTSNGIIFPHHDEHLASNSGQITSQDSCEQEIAAHVSALTTEELEFISRKADLRDVSKLGHRLLGKMGLGRERFSRRGMGLTRTLSFEVVLKWMSACTSVLLFPYFLRYWRVP
ncbi:transposase [Paenibacillus eucommiae]|uniref:Transposase-like protein n=1 Tax=Paenibacillus eucommiae TaxID=1355755 RepID=A0ABS4IS21_9BACL|nr:transposase [Paenibacillus eucommiae]MBP1990353.1 transposase-like protein [Paenibacillus eucommiae]